MPLLTIHIVQIVLVAANVPTLTSIHLNDK